MSDKIETWITFRKLDPVVGGGWKMCDWSSLAVARKWGQPYKLTIPVPAGETGERPEPEPIGDYTLERVIPATPEGDEDE